MVSTRVVPNLETQVLAVYAVRKGICADAAKAAKQLRKLNNSAQMAVHGSTRKALFVSSGTLAHAAAALDKMSDAQVWAYAKAFREECEADPKHLSAAEWPLLAAIWASALYEYGGD